MPNKEILTSVKPFEIYDAILLLNSSGISAQNLRELRQGLYNVGINSIYHHFWGRFLQAKFDDPEFNNDFASWANHSLHDKVLAERLSMLNPHFFKDLELLRQALIDIIEERLEESELLEWEKADYQFNFLYSKIIVMNTGHIINQPKDFIKIIPELPEGSIFYHFIDARRRTPEKKDDFTIWLKDFGTEYEKLRFALESLDPYFSSLKQLKKRMLKIFKRYLNRIETNGRTLKQL